MSQTSNLLKPKLEARFATFLKNALGVHTIDFYFARELLAWFGVTLLGLLSLFLLFGLLESLTQIERLGGLSNALIYGFLEVVKQIEVIVPLASLLSSAIVLGRFSGSGELMVMQLIGLNPTHLAKSVLKISLAIGLFTFIVFEGFGPLSALKANQIKYPNTLNEAQSGAQSQIWFQKDNTIVRIERSLGSQLEGVQLFEVEDLKIKSITQANQATFENDGWYLQSAKTLNFALDNPTSYEVSYLPAQFLSDVLGSQSFIGLQEQAEQQSVFQLVAQIFNHQALSLDTTIFQTELVARFNLILMVAAFCLISLPLIIKSHHRFGKTTWQVSLGLGLGLLMHLFSKIFEQLVLIYQLPAIVILPLTPLAVLGFCWFWLKRQF